MKDTSSIQNEYLKQISNFNKKNNFSHSIDSESYKILCEDFFSSLTNCQNAIFLAEESNMLELESEKKFLNWLEN